MLGTVVNSAAILAGGLLGLLFRGRIRDSICETVMQGVALAVMMIGLSSAVDMFVNGGANAMMLIMSLVAGGIFGTAMDLDGKFNRFAAFAERKLVKGGEGGTIAKSFLSGSVLYCVGTMSVIGAIESGALGKHDILFAKSMLDGVTAVIIAASMGLGVILSALPVFVYQGAITLSAGFLSPFITDRMLTDMSAAGGVLVFAISLNVLNITKIKLTNFLPSVFIPIVYYLLMEFIQK